MYQSGFKGRNIINIDDRGEREEVGRETLGQELALHRQNFCFLRETSVVS